MLLEKYFSFSGHQDHHRKPTLQLKLAYDIMLSEDFTEELHYLYSSFCGVCLNYQTNSKTDSKTVIKTQR